MDSFDGSRRRGGRPASSEAERSWPGERGAGRDPDARFREPEPLEQRLDRWMTTGRQLVEGVSGGRPGSRQATRRPEGRPGSRGGFDGLGRWVENRLDWLLDDSDDWPEPWQQRGPRRGEPPAPPERRGAAPVNRDGWERESRPAQAARADGIDSDNRREPPAEAPRGERPRRPLEAISRRGAPPATAADPARTEADWPQDDAFSLPRWQRPSAPLTRPDPLQLELEQRRRPDDAGGAAETAPASRPLPRSSRRR